MRRSAGTNPRRERLWRAAAAILGAVLLGLGCSPLNAFYFLWPADPKFPPECPLACKDKKETTLVVFASLAAADMHPETFGADQELTERLIQVLRQRFQEEKENIKIVPPYLVRQYRNQDIAVQTPYEIGKHFHADKVVYLEIHSLSLYKSGSYHQLFFGQVSMTVTVTDLSQPQEAGPIFRKEYIRSYPRSGEIPAEGSNPAYFRAHFLDNVAQDVARYFTPYTTDDKLEHERD